MSVEISQTQTTEDQKSIISPKIYKATQKRRVKHLNMSYDEGQPRSNMQTHRSRNDYGEVVTSLPYKKAKKLRHARNSNVYDTGGSNVIQSSQPNPSARYKIFDELQNTNDSKNNQNNKIFDDSTSENYTRSQNNDLDEVYINLHEIDKNISDIPVDHTYLGSQGGIDTP